MAQPPTTNPGLVANMVCRVILAFVGIMVSWVPLRLLVRNGEFAAVVFIVDVAIMNLITIVNSIIWHDDDWDKWFDGMGLCDVEVYVAGPLQTIYAASVFAIIYHLAQQVKVTSVGRDRRKRLRRNLIQAAIIFPVPFIQLVFTYFDLAQRYIIGTLIGCTAVYDASWPKTLVYDLPPAVFAVLSVPYAVLLWIRYRAITKQVQGILKADGEASIRANRTRRRLYNMSFLILLIYAPVMIYFLIINIKGTFSSYQPYDYNRIHGSISPYPWNTILFAPSWVIPSDVMNQPWIPIATTVVIVAFFGTTVEAQQMYRQYAEDMKLEACLRKFKRKRDQPPHLAVDENGKSRENSDESLRNRMRDSLDYHVFGWGHDTILPSIERSGDGEPKTTRPPAGLKAPPAIPPRHSSLRAAFAKHAPTMGSIRRSLRIPSLRSNTATNNAIAMQALPTTTVAAAAAAAARRDNKAGPQERRHQPSSFLSEDARNAAVRRDSASSLSLESADSGFGGRGAVQVRIPIIRRSAVPYYSDYHTPSNSAHTIDSMYAIDYRHSEGGGGGSGSGNGNGNGGGGGQLKTP